MRRSGLSFLDLAWWCICRHVYQCISFDWMSFIQLSQSSFLALVLIWLSRYVVNSKGFIGCKEMHIHNSKSNDKNWLSAFNWYRMYYISCILAVTKFRRSNYFLSKMNYFQNLEIHLSILGYLPIKNPPKWFQNFENLLERNTFFRTLNFIRKCNQQKVRIAVIFFFLVFLFLSVLLFVLFEANNFMEYSGGIYFLSVSINFILHHSILSRQKDRLSELMNKFNNMVQTSKTVYRNYLHFMKIK